MVNADYQILEPGKVHIEYGPVSAVITAFCGIIPLTEQCIQSIHFIEEGLNNLGREMSSLKSSVFHSNDKDSSQLSEQMRQAVLLTDDESMTPMAAVAGTMSDMLADHLFQGGATRVTVNNGGDIAIRLRSSEQVRLGVSGGLSDGINNLDIITLTANDGVGGVATSGLGGRSLTRGIADSVSVLAENCRTADAFATYLANASFVNCSEVHTVKAAQLDPSTDIPHLDVVTKVAPLPASVIKRGLEQISYAAQSALKKNVIKKVIATIQGQRIELIRQGDK